MRENDRQRIRVRRPRVDEMNAEPVYPRAILREGVDTSLEPTQVVRVAPISDQRLSLLERNALRPVADRLALRPASHAQPALQVAECFLGKSSPEWRHRFGSRRQYKGCRRCACLIWASQDGAQAQRAKARRNFQYGAAFLAHDGIASRKT